MNFKAKVVRTIAAVGLTLVMTTGIAFASIGTATVTAGSLRLRSQANTVSTILAQAPRGSTVTVEEDVGNGWYKVTYGGKTGYMSGEWLSVSLNSGNAASVASETEAEQTRGLITAGVLNIRAGAGTNYNKVGTLRAGTVVDIIADMGNGWYQISSGYICADYVTLVGAGSEASSELGAAAAAMAESLVGSRYVYGASGPNSFDCSGLMYYIYMQLGHPIARSSSSQYYNSGYFISTSELQPGDLIFFFNSLYDSSGGTLPTTHVGMYVGNGQFVHASSPSTGVRYDSIYSVYHAPYIVGAKRIG